MSVPPRLRLTRTHVRRLHKVDYSHNDTVGMFLAAVMVFYGITLGLVAVGTWGNFTSVSDSQSSSTSQASTAEQAANSIIQS